MAIRRITAPEGFTVGKLFVEPDTEARVLAYSIADDGRGIEGRIKIAKYHLRRKRKYPRTTLPESIWAFYADKFREEYVEQYALFGGRAYRGGSIPDFIVVKTNVAVLIQGNHWHTGPGKRERDRLQIESILQGGVYGGLPITAVVEVWESKLMGPGREKAVKLSFYGVAIGK